MTPRSILSALLFASVFATAQPARAAEEGWLPLFNGKDLSGWEHKGGGQFLVQDNMLIGTQNDGQGGNLYTLSSWADFELKATYKMDWPANSGFWYRFDPVKEVGYQFDVLKWPNPVAFSGTLYCPGKMFLFANLDETKENRDDWNEARIVAKGATLTHWLNGKQMGVANDDEHAKGKIGIQVHPGDNFKGMKITIKSIMIRPLPAE